MRQNNEILEKLEALTALARNNKEWCLKEIDRLGCMVDNYYATTVEQNKQIQELSTKYATLESVVLVYESMFNTMADTELVIFKGKPYKVTSRDLHDGIGDLESVSLDCVLVEQEEKR